MLNYATPFAIFIIQLLFWLEHQISSRLYHIDDLKKAGEKLQQDRAIDRE